MLTKNEHHDCYYMWLTGIEGIGARTAGLLLEAFGSPGAIWQASESALRESRLLTKTVLPRLVDSRSQALLDRLMDDVDRLEIQTVTLVSDQYPQMLKHIYDPPVLLYYKGYLPKENELTIAVIGTRKPTEYGKGNATAIALELARAGVNVVSGMARGIDALAHKGALKVEGRTTAVLGSGVDIVYPPENEDLMRQIVQNGCVISEYPPGTSPSAGHFPARNRIISGLSHGVLVVEAGRKSGTLITVNQALEQGRDVFALPGNVSSAQSHGTNDLIQDGAMLVSGAADILDSFSHVISPQSQPVRKTADEGIVYGKNERALLTPDENNIYDVIGVTEPVHADQIIYQTGLEIQTVTYILAILEMRDYIKQLPGNRYIRALNY